MIKQVRNFILYLLGKTSEIGDLDTKDVLLAKVVLDIHRKRTHTRPVMVPLFSLQQIHAIDRDNAVAIMEKRVGQLKKVKGKLLEESNLTRKILDDYLPSVSGIKVVKENEQSYIAYEGNGRLVAMQRVFSPDDMIMVEVEEYFFRKPKKVVNRMKKVRRMNGFMD